MAWRCGVWGARRLPAWPAPRPKPQAAAFPAHSHHLPAQPSPSLPCAAPATARRGRKTPPPCRRRCGRGRRAHAAPARRPGRPPPHLHTKEQTRRAKGTRMLHRLLGPMVGAAPDASYWTASTANVQCTTCIEQIHVPRVQAQRLGRRLRLLCATIGAELHDFPPLAARRRRRLHRRRRAGVAQLFHYAQGKAAGAAAAKAAAWSGLPAGVHGCCRRRGGDDGCACLGRGRAAEHAIGCLLAPSSSEAGDEGCSWEPAHGFARASRRVPPCLVPPSPPSRAWHRRSARSF